MESDNPKFKIFDDSLEEASADWTVISVRETTTGGISLRAAKAPYGRPKRRAADGHPSDTEQAREELTVGAGSRLTLSTDFELRGMIGAGGQGAVFEAMQENLGRKVAAKVARRPKNDEECEAFFREAYTTAVLDHPNIIPVHDMGLIADGNGIERPVLTMKQVRGESWLAQIARDRKAMGFTLEAFLARHIPILIQVTHALDYAHARNIIHRDLKPSQIMVGEYGEVYLLDWGLAMYVGGEAPRSSKAIDLSRLLDRSSATNPSGTPSFMAPEQASDETHELGIHTDVYLLGATLYSLIRGFAPHHAPSVMEALYKAGENEYAPLPPTTPKALVDLVDWCLKSDPKERPASAAEVRRVLEDWVTGAGRIEESRRLVGEARTELFTPGQTPLSESARKLDRAGTLWPQNPELEAMRDTVRARFVAQAVKRGDLLIALVQARRVADKDLRAELYKEIEQCRNEQRASLKAPPLLNWKRGLVVMALWLVALLAVIGVESAARNMLIEEVMERAVALAALGSGTLPVGEVMALDESRDMESAEFHRLLALLNNIRERDADIRYVTVMRPEFDIQRDYWRVVIDADPYDEDIDGDGIISDWEMGVVPGQPIDTGNDAQYETFRLQRPTGGITRNMWGSFIAGYAPIIDPETNRSVAILTVDIEAHDVFNKMGTVRLAAFIAWIVLAGLLTFAMFAYYSSRCALHVVHQMEERLREINREMAGEDIYLG